MNDWFKQVSVCPVCKSSLNWENLSPEDSKLKDLFFVACTRCDSEYPLWLDRPILISKNRFIGWAPAIDEALNLKGGHRSTPKSVAWLSTMINKHGLEECISWIQHDVDNIQESNDWHILLKEIELKAKMRKSGERFDNNKHQEMYEKHTKPIPSNADERSLSDEFVFMTLRANPKRLLDIGSGGASNLSRTLGVGAKVDFAVGTDRDLKCLWTTEYKLSVIGKHDISEPVGADVRQLPFTDDFFDYATSWFSLGEICGIEKMLREVFRVLILNGRFQVSFYRSSRVGQYSEAYLKWISKMLIEHEATSNVEAENIVDKMRNLSRKDYEQFAKAADIFIDEEDFFERAKRTGFKIKHTIHRIEDDDDCFITILRKPSS